MERFIAEIVTIVISENCEKSQQFLMLLLKLSILPCQPFPLIEINVQAAMFLRSDQTKTSTFNSLF